MKIQLLIERKGGTRVPFGADFQNPDIVYDFSPTEPGGPHVAEVKDQEHIKRLLSIRPQAYVEFGASAGEDDDEAESREGQDEDEGEGDDLSDLRKAYKAATGRNWSPKWDAATLREKIAALPPAEG